MIWDCGSSKSPGPDGLSFGFIKRYWDPISDDMVYFVTHFYSHSHITVGCIASFFTVIPKFRYPKNVRDFRLISLIRCQYKIIGQLLANRLAEVIVSVVSL